MQRKPKAVSTLEDLVRGNFIQTPSAMFRGRLFGEFPDWFYKVDRGDWPLHVLNARHGYIGYLDEIMATYRADTGGIYSSKNRVEQLKGAMHAAEAIDVHLNYRYHEIISNTNTSRMAKIIELLAADDDWSQVGSYALKYLRKCGVANRQTMTMLKRIIKGYFPWICRIQRQVNSNLYKT
jgi:hypothetical protein